MSTPADPYEQRPGRSAFWIKVALATEAPAEIAATSTTVALEDLETITDIDTGLRYKQGPGGVP